MSRWRRQLHRRHRLVRQREARFLAEVQRLCSSLPTYPGMRRFSMRDMVDEALARMPPEEAEAVRRLGLWYE